MSSAAGPAEEDGRDNGRRGPLWSLLSTILNGGHVVAVTGGGLAIASAIPPFRHPSTAERDRAALEWASVAKFQAAPLEWWNSFWLKGAGQCMRADAAPNAAHAALAAIVRRCPKTRVVTECVDGLHRAALPDGVLAEAFGRVDAFRCVAPACARSTAAIDARDVPLEWAGGVPGGSLDRAPVCPSCGAPVLPLVQFEHEPTTAHAGFEWTLARQFFAAADLVLLVGAPLGGAAALEALGEAARRRLRVYHVDVRPREAAGAAVGAVRAALDSCAAAGCEVTHVNGKPQHFLPLLAWTLDHYAAISRAVHSLSGLPQPGGVAWDVLGEFSTFAAPGARKSPLDGASTRGGGRAGHSTAGALPVDDGDDDDGVSVASLTPDDPHREALDRLAERRGTNTGRMSLPRTYKGGRGRAHRSERGRRTSVASAEALGVSALLEVANSPVRPAGRRRAGPVHLTRPGSKASAFRFSLSSLPAPVARTLRSVVYDERVHAAAAAPAAGAAAAGVGVGGGHRPAQRGHRRHGHGHGHGHSKRARVDAGGAAARRRSLSGASFGFSGSSGSDSLSSSGSDSLSSSGSDSDVDGYRRGGGLGRRPGGRVAHPRMGRHGGSDSDSELSSDGARHRHRGGYGVAPY